LAHTLLNDIALTKVARLALTEPSGNLKVLSRRPYIIYYSVVQKADGLVTVSPTSPKIDKVLAAAAELKDVTVDVVEGMPTLTLD